MMVRDLDFPGDLHFLVEHQVWARRDGDDFATVGITALGIRLSGEVYMCRPKQIGSELEQGRSVAVVELAKSIVSVKSPVRGTVVAVNSLLERQPELVHTDPYGSGWIARVRLHDFEADRAALVHGDAVAAAMDHHAWLNQVE
ncbi:MAG: glycine cleavage system protein H [Ideonella sp.]